MKAKKPLISIITVSYNAIISIEETLKSIIGQTYDNFEYIIIDGGSTDGTKEILEKYREYFSYYVSEPDQGIYHAMNKGVLKATGQFIYFIGADDTLIGDSVLNTVSKFLLDEDKVYYGNVIFSKRNIIYDGKFNSIKLVTRNISHQSIFYPAGVFKEFRFNPKYRIFADYDLNLKLFGNSSFTFKYLPITIAIFNDEGASGTNTQDVNFEKDRLCVIKNNFPY
jgi:cellulose synthase/poly-beta-1,6-N-acetylglucosamine synthase-like glycosyltransferase